MCKYANTVNREVHEVLRMALNCAFVNVRNRVLAASII